MMRRKDPSEVGRRKYPGWVLGDEKWQKVRAGTTVKIVLMPDLWPRLEEAADRAGWHLHHAMEIREGDIVWAEVLCDGASIFSLEEFADVVMSLGGTARLVRGLEIKEPEPPDHPEDLDPRDMGCSRQTIENRGTTPMSKRLRKTDRVRVVADVPAKRYVSFVLRCMDHGIGIIREELRDGENPLDTLELDARTEGQVERCIDLAAMCQGRCRVTPVYERPGAAE